MQIIQRKGFHYIGHSFKKDGKATYREKYLGKNIPENIEDLIKRHISPNKHIRDVQETLNHINVFFDVINKKEEFSENLMLKWHYELFKDTKKDIAGKIRDYLVRVGEYRAPDWQDIESLLKDLFIWLEK